MEHILIGFLSGLGLLLLWIKLCGFERAMEWQVLGDMIGTGLLLVVGFGTMGGTAVALTGGLFLSISLWLLSLTHS